MIVKEGKVAVSLVTRYRDAVLPYVALGLFILTAYHFFSDGDFSFLMTLSSLFRAFAFVLVLYKIHSQRSCSGLSLKTLQCYVAVFFYRLCSILVYDGYLPFDRSGDWLYQFVEVAALCLVGGCVFMVITKYRDSYDARFDRFGNYKVPNELGIVWILVPALLLAIILHPTLNNFFLTDVSWTFALYIEAVAIFPQLYMFQKKGGEIEPFTSHFVFCLGVARLLSLIFWLSTHSELNDRYSLLPTGNLVGYMVLLSEVLQLVLMVDFIYCYLKSYKEGGPVMLPQHV